MSGTDEDTQLQAVALRNTSSILAARRQAMHDLEQARDALARRNEEFARSQATMKATLPYCRQSTPARCPPPSTCCTPLMIASSSFIRGCRALRASTPARSGPFATSRTSAAPRKPCAIKPGCWNCSIAPGKT